MHLFLEECNFNLAVRKFTKTCSRARCGIAAALRNNLI